MGLEVPGVTRKTRPAGGYYTIGLTEYWFPQDLYDQVLAEDDATPNTRKGDKQFDQFIKAFIKDHASEIEEVSRTPERRSYGFGMSDYWAMPYTYGGKKGVSDNTVRRATVLRAMRTILSVVDPEHRLTVDYTEEITSGWMDGKVKVPVGPVDTIDDLAECINIMSGFDIHEAWHSIHSRPLFEGDDRTTMLGFLGSDPWNQYLWNTVEDVREEELGLQDTPGYKDYLNYVMEFLWNDTIPLPKSWPTGTDGPELNAKAMALHMWLREPDRAADILTDPSFDEPRKWVEDWGKRYCDTLNRETTAANCVDLIKEARQYLGMPDIPSSATAPSSEIMVLSPCGYTNGDDGIDDIESEDVADAIEAEIEEVDNAGWLKTFGWNKDSFRNRSRYDGDYMNKAVILRPRVKYPASYKPAPSSLVDKAKAALALRNTTRMNDVRLQKHGELDEDELYRFFTGDMRFFKDNSIENLPNAAVYLLVDMSGSMGDATYSRSSSYYAVQIARVFVEALSKHPNVKVRVLGHTGDNQDCPEGGAFYRIWEQGDPINRLQYMYEMGEVMGNNYDGYGIAWAGQLIREEAVDQRTLIVLSDGQPAGEEYGGYSAMRHVRLVTDKLLRQGVDVIQVAVGDGIPSQDQATMFKHFIELDRGNFAGVFNKLTKVLERFVR